MERQRTGNGTVGSNPTPSANKSLEELSGVRGPESVEVWELQMIVAVKDRDPEVRILPPPTLLKEKGDMSVQSPCIGMCYDIDLKKRVCLGCYRSVKEVAEWYDMTDAQKKAVLKRCKQRSRREEHGRSIR